MTYVSAHSFFFLFEYKYKPLFSVLLTFFFNTIHMIKQIVSVVLENYGGPKRISENLDTDKPGPQNRWVQEVLKNEGHATPLPEVITRVPSWRTIVKERGEVNMTA